VLAAVLVLLHGTVCCGAKQSSYDRERDRQLEAKRKEAARLQAQKLEEAARTKKEQQVEESRDKYREKYIELHPGEFYNTKVVGRYGLQNGKPVPLVPISGQVQEVVKETRVIVRMPARGTSVPETFVLVMLEKAQPLAKGQDFSMPNTIEIGTYAYSKPDGTALTIKAYRETPGITYKEFLQLRKDGYKFPGEGAQGQKNAE